MLGDKASSTMETIFEWTGSAISIIYFLTPLYQIFYLYKGKLHVRQIPLVLLLSILFNCLFWDLFAIFRTDSIWLSMLITNSIGLFFNCIIMFLYLYLLCDKHIWKFIGYGVFVLNVLVEIGYLMYYYVIISGAKDDQGGINVVGFIGMVMNVIMYTSPCLNIIDVFKTGQTQFLPILTNIIGFFAALTWLFSGLLTGENKTIISNGVSLFVLIVQIGIWFYFFYQTSKQKEENRVTIGDVGKFDNQSDNIANNA